MAKILSFDEDARLYVGLFDGAEAAAQPIASGRNAYVHVARGALEVNGRPLAAGDAAMLSGEREVKLAGGRAAEVLVFDLP